MNQLCRFATSRPTLSLIIAILLALPFLIQLPRVRTVDNVDYFTVEGDPDVAFYETIKQTFGEDEFFVVAFSSPDLFSPRMLRLVADLTLELEALPEVREVQSLANVDFIQGSADYFEVRPFLERIPEDREGLDLLRSQALENRLYVGNLVSTDGMTTALAVFPREHDPGEGSFRAV
jgi:predicted RND superfamily exporter protein